MHTLIGLNAALGAWVLRAACSNPNAAMPLICCRLWRSARCRRADGCRLHVRLQQSLHAHGPPIAAVRRRRDSVQLYACAVVRCTLHGWQSAVSRLCACDVCRRACQAPPHRRCRLLVAWTIADGAWCTLARCLSGVPRVSRALSRRRSATVQRRQPSSRRAAQNAAHNDGVRKRQQPGHMHRTTRNGERAKA